MPTPPSPEPLFRTTLNLYLTDAEFLKRRYGLGWTTTVRELIREHVKILRALTAESKIKRKI